MFLRTNKKLKNLEVFGIIYNNNLSFKNLCKINTISSLHLYENEDWDNSEEVIEILSKNTTLTSLRVNGINIGIEGGKALAKALYKNNGLTFLELKENKICIEDFSYNVIGSEGGKALARALHVNNSLTSLNLHYNNVGNKGAKAFEEAIHINTALTYLKISCNAIIGYDGKELKDALKKKASLTCFA
ncbi:Protein NLRC3 [Gigaspora margarita]|uniref:Protein NLRC3 n=1 Tax=Gigaspora margarita TaxID=4874 RepID=A0A8H3X0Z8_GIGMA|nr:Protein NLRC3 [Gigaspora margarita]